MDFSLIPSHPRFPHISSQHEFPISFIFSTSPSMDLGHISKQSSYYAFPWYLPQSISTISLSYYGFSPCPPLWISPYLPLWISLLSPTMDFPISPTMDFPITHYGFQQQQQQLFYSTISPTMDFPHISHYGFPPYHPLWISPYIKLWIFLYLSLWISPYLQQRIYPVSPTPALTALFLITTKMDFPNNYYFPLWISLMSLSL